MTLWAHQIEFELLRKKNGEKKHTYTYYSIQANSKHGVQCLQFGAFTQALRVQ